MIAVIRYGGSQLAHNSIWHPIWHPIWRRVHGLSSMVVSGLPGMYIVRCPSSAIVDVTGRGGKSSWGKGEEEREKEMMTMTMMMTTMMMITTNDLHHVLLIIEPTIHGNTAQSIIHFLKGIILVEVQLRQKYDLTFRWHQFCSCFEEGGNILTKQICKLMQNINFRFLCV